MLYSFSSSVISYGVLSCVFTFWVPFCDVRYDFRITTMFGYLSLAFLYYSLLITTVLEWMNDLKSVCGVLYHDLLYLFDNCKTLFSEMECRNKLDGICTCTALGRSESSFPVEPTGTCWCFWLTTYLLFGGRVFQQTVGIPMDTNCVPLLVDLFLYSF